MIVYIKVSVKKEQKIICLDLLLNVLPLVLISLHGRHCSYIKEFVHGDFGRTKPNLCDLMKTDADILELDVEVRFI